jgi:hypothetical protein
MPAKTYPIPQMKGLSVFNSHLACFNITPVTDDSGDEAAAAKLWAVYISEAEKYDRALVESWKSDMDGLLIFVSVQSIPITKN